jgi:formylmethanofuran dehydrogenase subunit E
MSDYEILFNKAKAFHGHVCGGIILGTRLTLAGMRELGMNPHEHQPHLVVYLEIDRCGADAVQAITGCSLGHRNLKFMDYGKFAATFVDTATGRAIRVAVDEKDRAAHEKVEQKEMFRLLGEIPESEILKIERVQVDIPEDGMPGSPRHKETCSVCGEQIMNNRQIIVAGEVMCRNCGIKSYYTVLNS